MLLLEFCHCRLARASECDTKVDADRSLLITNLSVVNDRRSQNGGPWSFDAIFKQAIGDTPNPGVTAYDWLHQFSSKRSYNGYDLPDRSSGPLFAIWPITTSDSGGNVSLDLTKNPMTLLAIVFRTDIANEHFGEGRFVFGVTDPIKGPQDMTVIFEFLMQRTPNLPTKKAWYQAIVDLSKLENGEAYNRALHRLTAEFTYPYSGSTQLRRLRTNDQFFGQGWDMREFRYDRRERRLMMTAVEKTPDFSLNSETGNELTSWILENRETIIDGNYQLPGKFASGSGFLLDDTFSWFARNPNLDGELRQHFAVNTCSGCHGRATKTAFLHLSPRTLSEESKKSDHLTQDLIKRKTQLQDFICGQ